LPGEAGTGLVVENFLSNNVGGVNTFWDALFRAVRRVRHSLSIESLAAKLVPRVLLFVGGANNHNLPQRRLFILREILITTVLNFDKSASVYSRSVPIAGSRG
jgi:hypothetical protein